MSKKFLLATNPARRTIPAQGVDLDGALDYFSRSSDLTGNVDSKTFTFSAWVYLSTVAAFQVMYRNANGYFYVSLNASNQLAILGLNPSGLTILNALVSVIPPINTFYNIQISIDLTSTSNRSIYINDLVQSVTWTTYTNDTIDFTRAGHGIAATDTGLNKFKGRLSNVFLDYTYRDLSIEANRRLFIDSNGKPADGWKSLSPIIGMNMKDAATAHINDYGTGGNFTPNGTYATSNRGANQDNCVASYFDGTADYLSRTSLTGIADGKQLTVSFTTKFSIASEIVFSIGNSGTLQMYIATNKSNGGYLEIYVAGAIQASSTVPYVLNSTVSIQISFDLTSTSLRHIVVNGVANAGLWETYTNANMDLTADTYRIGAGWAGTPNNYFNGNIGELYFNTAYIDLATSNPFWDSVENKPIPVRKVIADTGVTPLIAMPLDASNAGKNYGTCGDFTVNSGPYVGARGASEFWARSAKFDGTTGYLTSSGLTGITDAKTITIIGHIYKNASTLYHLIGSTNSNVSLSINASNQPVITAKNAAGTTILSATVTTTIANTTWTSLLLSIDLSNSANRSVYLNGVLASVTWTTYTNDIIDFTNASWVIGADVALGNKFAGTMSLMMDNTYIDFSSELNRLKYIDGLGYPLDINSQVTKGALAQPALYLASRDTTNLGLNSGYGGNLTVNGTVTAGADVLG